MLIEILSDTVCPWCYIGQKRLKQALAMRPSVTYDLQWRPFRLDPTMPAEGLDRDAYLIAKFGTLERADRNQERVRKAGAEEGIDFRFDRIKRAPNSVNSHRLIRHTQAYGLQEAVVEALYRACFLDGQDVGDIETLADIAATLGLNRADIMNYLAGDADRSQILAEDERARQQGVNGVPCYVIEDRYAVSGAQAPEVFLQIIDLVRQEEPESAETVPLPAE
jgi:predicted DsbA family dithiol-disulfide isomerase